MSTSVVAIHEIPLDHKIPWTRVCFAAPCAVRLLEPPGALSDVLSDIGQLKLHIAVHAPVDEHPDWKDTWEEYVVGVQTNRGIQGAPREFLAWEVQRRPIYGILHFFRLGTVRRAARAPRTIQTLPYEVTPWTP